ncbi:MAG: endolytic transglycosylase MltG, partial [bacterium]|nr:endolytic transglycosylase MltG [bacterium]
VPVIFISERLDSDLESGGILNLGFYLKRNFVKRKYKILLIVIIVLLIDILIVLGVYIYTPLTDQYFARTVTIPPKTSTYGIALLLERAELINSPMLFVVYVKLGGATKSLKAGNYQLDSKMSLAEIVKRLRLGAEATGAMLTIPEGYNLLQIANALQSRAILNAEDFLTATRAPEYLARYTISRDNLEGYLFPDTYRFYPNIPAKKAIDLMLNQFDKMVLPLYQESSKHTKYSLDQIITLASLIEKEAGIDAEKKIIAAVFYNRLKRGMPLQCDPTIRYIVKKPSEPLTKEDMQINSPYNTYLKLGLPPGPICSPGLASIEAALHPEPMKYLYFVSRNDGTHEFSYTLDQHNAAVLKYQRNNKKEKAETDLLSLDSSTSTTQ